MSSRLRDIITNQTLPIDNKTHLQLMIFSKKPPKDRYPSNDSMFWIWKENHRILCHRIFVPPVLTSPRDDAIQLNRDFKGGGKIVGYPQHQVESSFRKRPPNYEMPSVGLDPTTSRTGMRYCNGGQYSFPSRCSIAFFHPTQRAVLLWMHDPAERDATVIRQAFLSDITNLSAATEVICSRTPSQIQLIKQNYHSKFGIVLEQDVAAHTSGGKFKAGDIVIYNFVQLLLAYLSTHRSEGLEVDREKAMKDAKALFKAGEKKLGTDEKTFICVFSERSRAQLATISAAYHDMYGGSLKKAVKSETSGKFEHGLLTILKCPQNPAKYFAKVLHDAMKGLRTDDSTVIRVIVTRTEIDMHYIKAEYLRKYKKTLNDAIHSGTSGHYRTFLLSLLGSNH
ncbi:monoglyceride lipase-like [Hibiscus syriacus]|uniref:Monoglyceride lipase-like n=1 Tax=Hibiscus syriacus TaxID=106335 RepID=A0A6A3B0R7_HIBSY|nr:monoglyceride lipase-like [Hibiscus syriacus]